MAHCHKDLVWVYRYRASSESSPYYTPLADVGSDNHTPSATPDLVKRPIPNTTAIKSGSAAELAAQLARLQAPVSASGGTAVHPHVSPHKTAAWDHVSGDKMELASDSEETDSVSTTPTESPVHRATSAHPHHRVAAPPSSLFRSGSSFGLHSPEQAAAFITAGAAASAAADNCGFQVYIDNIAEMEMLRRHRRLDSTDGTAPAADSATTGAGGEESSLYLDSDIIDLCQIPIPEPNEIMLYAEIEVPPTPFRDPLTPFPGCSVAGESLAASSSDYNHRTLLDDIAEGASAFVGLFAAVLFITIHCPAWKGVM